jgi:predicted transcriptional regulator
VTADAAIAERLDRLEREVAALRAGVLRAEPARLTQDEAAATLGVSRSQVKRYAVRGLLVKLPKASARHRTYYDPANVDALARSEDAARDWVANRKYVPHGKRR